MQPMVIQIPSAQVVAALERGVAHTAGQPASPLRDVRLGCMVERVELVPGGVRVHVKDQVIHVGSPVGDDWFFLFLPGAGAAGARRRAGPVQDQASLFGACG